MGFPVVMYGCESWTVKKAVTEELMLLNCGVRDSWESLGQEKIKPVNPKGNQSGIFIRKTDAKTEAKMDKFNWEEIVSTTVGKNPLEEME